MQMHDLYKEANQDVANFLGAYAELLRELGGDDMVHQMHEEVKFRVNQGAELAEALAKHWEHTRSQYGLTGHTDPDIVPS